MNTVDRLKNYAFNHFTLLAGWNAQLQKALFKRVSACSSGSAWRREG